MRLLILLVFSLLVFASCKNKQKLTNSTVATTETTEIQKKYAEKLAVDVTNIANNNLYQFIDDWYAVPYKYAGKTKEGIDCSGFTSTLYQNVYKKNISSSTKALIVETTKIKPEELKEGDLVFFKIESKTVSHVGVYLQNNKFVHASTKRGVIISDLNEPYYKKYFLSAGRVK